MPPKSSKKNFHDPMRMMMQKTDDFYLPEEQQQQQQQAEKAKATSTAAPSTVVPSASAEEQDASDIAQQLLQQSKQQKSESAAGSEGGNSDDFDADAFERDFEADDDDGTGGGGGSSNPNKNSEYRHTTPYFENLMAKLPAKIRTRVQCLLQMDRRYLEIEREFTKKREALKRRFEKEAEPLMQQRRDIVCGAAAATDDLIEEGFPFLHQSVGIPLPTLEDERYEQERLKKNSGGSSKAKKQKNSSAEQKGAAAASAAANDDDDDDNDSDGGNTTNQRKSTGNSFAVAMMPRAADSAVLQKQGLPGFWLRVLKHHVIVRSLISDRDEEVLLFCTDVAVSTIDPEFGEGFTVRFEFARNPFFRNKMLVKTFHTKDDEEDEMVVDFTSGTRIAWVSPEQNVTTKIIAHKARAAAGSAAGAAGGKKSAKNKRATRTVKKQVRVNSLFRFFFDEITDPQDAELEDAYAYDAVEEEQWLGLGLVLQDKLVPYAAEHYTGEASNGLSDCDDDSEWDEEDEYEDCEEQEEEEDEKAPAAGAKKKQQQLLLQQAKGPGALSVAAKMAAGGNQQQGGGFSGGKKDENCKQQ